MKNILEVSKSRGKVTLQVTVAIFSNFNRHQNHLEVLLNHRLPSSILRVLDSVGLE